MTRSDLGATLVAALLAAMVVVVRPPLPIDETRYVQVFEESLRGSAVLLRLLGEPYAEKPPLLFWLAWPFTWLGAASSVALRLVPALATAATVALASRIGRRAGLDLTGWVQASLLLGLLCGQMLLFDPLLACAISGAALAWLERRPLATYLGVAAAFLAKGPVAALFLLAYAWSLAPLRAPGPRRIGRSLALLAAGLLPLAAWALGAAWLGGPDFARALLWERWAGRVVQSFDHQRAIWFYVPVLLVGGLPGVFVLFQRELRERARASGWAWRVLTTAAALLVFFSLVSGKQAHYLVPLAPLLALVVAFGLQHTRAGVARLRLGILVQLILFAGLLIAAFVVRGKLLEASGERGAAFLAGGSWIPAVLVGTAALATGAGVLWRARAPGVLVKGAAITAGVFLLGLHSLAGSLLFPHDLARVLSEHPDVPVTYLGSSHRGLFPLLSEQRAREPLTDRAAIEPWGATHPDGLILVDPEDLEGGLPPGFDVLGRDVAHRSEVVVLRLAGGSKR